MKRTVILFLIASAALIPMNSANAIGLYDWAINLNGTTYRAPALYSPPDAGQLPDAVDATGFDWGQGIGSISISYNGLSAGDYYVGAFFDHEIDEAINTYFNEYGDSSGTPAANQSWEIDEPGWIMGDIYDNLQYSSLDNTNSITAIAPDDVSMAMGWNFSLDGDQSAVINFYLSEIMPDSDFYLLHRDPDSDISIYFSSDINITDINHQPAPVPEPATMTLMGIGLIGLASSRKRKSTHGQ